MNLSVSSRVRTLATTGPCGQNGWKGCLTKASILALGFGAYVLIFRIDFIAGGKWCFYRLRKYFPRGKDHPDIKGTRSVLAYNRDICLGAPRSGVRDPCGHLLCPNCLASYCDIRGATAPPCPLCRAPLKFVALAPDIPSSLNPNIPDVTIDATTREWVREYNLHQGCFTGEDFLL